MAYLTATDQQYLDSLGIRVLCDFRTARERAREVVRWSRSDLDYLKWEYDPEQVSLRGVLGPYTELTPEAARGAMIRLYRALPELFSEPYADLFARLAAGDLPLVFGCSAGKDRTGVAAALVLTALGVPWEHVLEDFQLTERVVDLDRVLLQHPRDSVGLGGDELRVSGMPREVRAPLLAASADYLEAAFDSIASAYGSVAGYLSKALAVTEEDLTRIRHYLLE